MKHLNLQKLAKATGGVAVHASTIEVRMLDAYHAHKGTSNMKLPLVFEGGMDQVRAWAKTNKYKEVVDRPSLYGIHFQDDHGNAYILT